MRKWKNPVQASYKPMRKMGKSYASLINPHRKKAGFLYHSYNIIRLESRKGAISLQRTEVRWRLAALFLRSEPGRWTVYFRLAGIGVLGGLRSASVGAEQRSTGPLAPPNQCKTQCVLRIWQKLYARFWRGNMEISEISGIQR